MAESWRVQWRTLLVTDPADQSATFKAYVEEWVRVNPDDGETRDDFSRSPSQRYRPRLQSPGVSLNHSRNATEAPSSGAFDLWDDFNSMTLPEIFQKKFPRPIGATAHSHLRQRHVVRMLAMILHTLPLRGTQIGVGTWSGARKKRVGVTSTTGRAYNYSLAGYAAP